jgi:type I restriction enzyme S subunit
VSFPRYPKYKPSGVEWLGEVPEHWSRVRLKQVYSEIDVRAGGDAAELLGLSKVAGVVRRSELQQSASESDDYSKYKLARAGDLVMNKMQAWNGVFGIAPVPGMVSPDYSVFAHTKPALDRFLCYLLRTDAMAGEFLTRSRGMGTAFLRLNTPDFLATAAFLPSDSEAHAIAAFLDRETAKIDALIAEQEKLIELLAEKRQAVISHAVTKGLNPAAPMKPSGIEWLGDVPAHWTSWKASRGFRIIGSGTTPKSDAENLYDGDILWVTTSELRESVITDTAKKLTATALREYTALRVYPPGTLLLAMYGATIGRLGVLGTSATVNQACVAFSEPEFLETWFTFYWLQMRKPVLVAIATGGGQPNLSQDDLRQLRIPAPDVREQRAIALFLDGETAKFDSLITEAQKGIDLLRERRSALISAAVTGQIDVRNAVPEGAA